MLTNNKKNFVRSIAMLLVLLMVVAMGLTACNKNAITEEVDPTVDQKLAAALEPYIKADDKAAVAAIVKEVLGDEGISAEKVETLTAALDKYITADDAKALITDEVAKIALDDAMTKQDVLDILKDYYTKAEVDAKLKSYFGDFTPAQVKAMMDDMDKAMNLEDWNKATELVLATIDGMQKLLTAVTTEIYTQTNMAKVNEAVKILGITPFQKASTAADALLVRPTATADLEKNLEYRILRAANVEEIEELKAAVDAALAVPTFKSEMTALANKLYAMGEEVVIGDYSGTNGAFKPATYTAATKYHGKNYAKDAQVKAQVVTLNDVAAFNQWNRDYDDLMVKYINESTLVAQAGSASDLKWSKQFIVYNVFKKVAYDGTVTIETSTAATLDGFTKIGQTMFAHTVANGLTYLKAKFGVAEVPAGTILALDKNTVFDYFSANATYMNMAGQANWKADGKYGYEGNDTFTTDAMGPNNYAGHSYLRWNVGVAYGAILSQLQECNTAVYTANEANDIFKNFLLNTVVNGSALKDDVRIKNQTLTADQILTILSDTELLNALTAAMCEAGSTTYGKYLTDVTTEFDQAIALNGQTTVGLYRYSLYEQMKSKAYDLLWDKYKLAAQKTAATMLKDYISLVYEAKANTITTSGQNTSDDLPFKNTTNLAAAMTAGGETTVATDLTTGFVNAYLNGTTDGKLAGTVYETLGKNFNATKLVAYYANNGQAKKVTTTVGSNMSYDTFEANPLKSLADNYLDVYQRLTGSMLSVSLKIDAADKAAMKESGVTVQKAFDGFLKEGIANLDEIIARFTIEDYKIKTYNDMTVKIDGIFNYYGVAANSAENAKGVLAMQQYLMGVDDTATNGSTTGFGGTVTYTAANATTVKSWTYGKNSFENSLNNAQLLTNVSAVTVNPYATSNGIETVKVAGEAQKAIDAAAANATLVIENVAIKTNFLSYLDRARQEWLNVYRQYTDRVAEICGVELDYELLLRMSMLSSEVDDTITVVKYYAEQDGIELKDYKENYVQILAMIGAESNDHLALLQKKSIEEVMADTANALGTKTFTDSKKLVLSTYVPDATKGESWKIGLGVNAEGAVQVDALAHVGTAVVQLDELVNEDTQIKTVTSTGTTYRNLY